VEGCEGGLLSSSFLFSFTFTHIDSTRKKMNKEERIKKKIKKKIIHSGGIYRQF
jgi:hypothetical protein